MTKRPGDVAASIIDLSATLEVIEDYELEIRENVVLRARMELTRGFIDVYRNFETGTTAYAWVVDEERVYGADNTGGWHRHPIETPDDHVDCDPVDLPSFVRQVESFITSGKR